MSEPQETPPPTAEPELQVEPSTLTAPGEIVTAVELVTMTLDELGDRLPASGKLYKFHPPNMGTMRRLGQLQADKALQRRPGHFVTVYLAAALAELDGDDMGPVERDPKRSHKVGSLPAGDVLTLLVAWTNCQHRKGIKLGGAGCGACGSTWDTIRVKLGELEVMTLAKGQVAEAAVARVGLWDGFKLHGRDVQTVILAAPTWGETMGSLSREGWANPVAIRASTIQGALRSCDAFPALGRIGIEALDELMPEDLELMDEALGRITPSVSLELSVVCPDCGATNEAGLDWKNLGFSNGPASP